MFYSFQYLLGCYEQLLQFFSSDYSSGYMVINSQGRPRVNTWLQMRFGQKVVPAYYYFHFLATIILLMQFEASLDIFLAVTSQSWHVKNCKDNYIHLVIFFQYKNSDKFILYHPKVVKLISAFKCIQFNIARISSHQSHLKEHIELKQYTSKTCYCFPVLF